MAGTSDTLPYTEHTWRSADGLNHYYRRYARRPGRPFLPSGQGVAPFSVLCLPGLTRNSRDFESLALNVLL